MPGFDISLNPESHGHDPDNKFVLLLVESQDKHFVFPVPLQVRHELSQAKTQTPPLS